QRSPLRNMRRSSIASVATPATAQPAHRNTGRQRHLPAFAVQIDLDSRAVDLDVTRDRLDNFVAERLQQLRPDGGTIMHQYETQPFFGYVLTAVVASKQREQATDHYEPPPAPRSRRNRLSKP